MGGGQKCLVISAHTPIYPDPISVLEGEKLTLTGRKDDWDGHIWLWAIDARGREGWVPGNLIPTNTGQQPASYTYSARELSIVPGEQVVVDNASHGWAWVADKNGETGWVPQNCLEKLI